MTHIHTQPWALYNEIDDYAAEWIENLIARGLVAPGIVDRRSIEDICPDELRGFRQVHCFAGIAVWSYALRRAGVSDDTALWTGSCPCQPFSAAGKGGGVDDERHLWPAFFHHIRECRPPKVYGEQVASKDGLAWVDLVQTDLEGANYAFGAVDTCSASVGAPHIRQRLRFVAHDLRSSASRLADNAFIRRQFRTGFRSGGPGEFGGYVSSDNGFPIGMDNNNNKGLEGFGRGHQTSIGHGQGPLRPASETGELGRLAHNEDFGRREQCAPVTGSGERGDTQRLEQRSGGVRVLDSIERTCPTNGFWRDADWLFCRDGKWRPVEPGSQPLANGAPARVGRLRAYGNAVDAEATREFIEATFELETIDLVPMGTDFEDVLG